MPKSSSERFFLFPRFIFLFSFFLTFQAIGNHSASQAEGKSFLESCPDNETFTTLLFQAVVQQEENFADHVYSLDPGNINNCSGFIGAIMRESNLVSITRNIWGEEYPETATGFPHANAQAQFSWALRQPLFDHLTYDWATAQKLLFSAPDGSLIFIENPDEKISHRGFGGITHVALLKNNASSPEFPTPIEIINFAQPHTSGPQRETVEEFLARYSYEDSAATIHVFSYNQENCR